MTLFQFSNPTDTYSWWHSSSSWITLWYRIACLPVCTSFFSGILSIWSSVCPFTFYILLISIQLLIDCLKKCVPVGKITVFLYLNKKFFSTYLVHSAFTRRWQICMSKRKNPILHLLVLPQSFLFFWIKSSHFLKAPEKTNQNKIENFLSFLLRLS